MSTKGPEKLRTTQDLIFHSDDWLTAEELDRQLQDMRSGHSAYELERQRRIFSVERDGAHYFARYQFNAHLEPLPVVREILVRLVLVESWAIAAWFHFPNGWIPLDDAGKSPVAPKDVLNRREELLQAAEKYRSTYVA
ncbi:MULTISPECIES: hypothetical protein [Telluria group]|uniref:hypothetical protein n=1 Tax=Telluria group TaxID=2895353 RepID=UPI00070ACB2D|nr:hypothetical protein [Duganella sp. Root1480D1]KQZ35126.1 hypothetical protein ASD58_28340 [Duganella sp. Root1480D1]